MRVYHIEPILNIEVFFLLCALAVLQFLKKFLLFKLANLFPVLNLLDEILDLQSLQIRASERCKTITHKSPPNAAYARVYNYYKFGKRFPNLSWTHHALCHSTITQRAPASPCRRRIVCRDRGHRDCFLLR